MHWWTDVVPRAHLASIDDRLAGQPLLVPPLSDWHGGLVARGRPGRILDLDVPGGELVIRKLYFPGVSAWWACDLARYRAGQCHASRQERGARWSVPCSGRRIFVPRSANGNRAILNEAGVTTSLTDNGFEIVFGPQLRGDRSNLRCCRGRRGPDGWHAGRHAIRARRIDGDRAATRDVRAHDRSCRQQPGRLGTPDPGVPCSGRWRIDATARGLRRHRGSG